MPPQKDQKKDSDKKSSEYLIETRSKASLSIDEKRQILYSSLLRYLPETIPLRERALGRVVIGGLLGSTSEEPFRIGRIQKNLYFGPNAPVIRIEAIQETLDRLVKQESVNHTLLRNRHAYYLTEKGNKDINKVVEDVAGLLTSVLSEYLKDTEQLLPFEKSAELFRRFIFECFARFGQLIAKNVTGLLGNEDFISAIDADMVFEEITKDEKLSEEARDSLRARCQKFLRSSEPNAEKVKFHLTQGFYFTQLLGIEGGKFDPLTDLAFSGSVFYLDTNVLIVGLLPSEESAGLFNEIIRITQRIGIELRVTRATINEARRTANEHAGHIEKFISVIPEELLHRSEDNFLDAFLDSREKNSSLTPHEFIEPFDRLSDILKDRWGIVIDERTETEIINGRDFSHAGAVINREAEEGRGWGKSEAVLEHDVCHYALITDERCENKKTWFLTKDRTLSRAANILTMAGSDQPFTFSMIGFLHSISPFVTSECEEESFVDLFSTVFTNQIAKIGPLFKTSELALLAEYHEDVLAIPVDKLIMALDFVKSHTLKGKKYDQSDIPKVSLELKQFLTSTKDEQVKALEAERARLEAEKEAERQKRRMAEENMRQRLADNQTLHSQIELLRTSDIEKQEQIDDLRALLDENENRFVQKSRQTWLLVAIAGIIFAAILWLIDDTLLLAITSKYPRLPSWFITLVESVLKAVGVVVFTLPALMFIRLTQWKKEIKLAVFIFVIALAIIFSHLINSDALSDFSACLGVAAIIATALMTGFSQRP